MPDVLFVCVHNAGRSQMAEAFFNQLAHGRALNVRAESAGTEPGKEVHPEVVEAMREVAVDLSGNRPRMLTSEMVEEAAGVVTMGCAPDATTCPAILFRKMEDWALPDPHGQSPQRVREIRDEIRRRVSHLLDDVERASAGGGRISG